MDKCKILGVNEHYAVNLDDNGWAYSIELRPRIAPGAFLYAIHVKQEIEVACSLSHFHPCAQESRFYFSLSEIAFNKLVHAQLFHQPLK